MRIWKWWPFGEWHWWELLDGGEHYQWRGKRGGRLSVKFSERKHVRPGSTKAREIFIEKRID